MMPCSLSSVFGCSYGGDVSGVSNIGYCDGCFGDDGRRVGCGCGGGDGGCACTVMLVTWCSCVTVLNGMSLRYVFL